MTKPSANDLIIAKTAESPDLFYAIRFRVPDPVLYLNQQGRSALVLSALEVDRGRREALVDEILPLEELHQRIANPKRRTGLGESAVLLLKDRNIRKVEVPPTFPLAIADHLRRNRISVTVRDPFYPMRENKSREEVGHIQTAQRQAEAGLAHGLSILKSATVNRRGQLKWGHRLLTSERLRFEIDQAVRRAGGEPDQTIVAGGRQACDPHEPGRGPLRSGECIILDIFPRDRESGYFGDLTRTVIKGKASEAQRALYDLVARGQAMALKTIRAGADGEQIQNTVKNFFTEAGYPTEIRGDRWVGFFHGLGHGVGLEIHEAPRMAAGRLKSGQVVTVEPGYYDPEIGGIRLEDLVVIHSKGNRNLTSAPHTFEIS